MHELEVCSYLSLFTQSALWSQPLIQMIIYDYRFMTTIILASSILCSEFCTLYTVLQEFYILKIYIYYDIREV